MSQPLQQGVQVKVLDEDVLLGRGGRYVVIQSDAQSRALASLTLYFRMISARTCIPEI
jgi:hypothetical protein